VFLALYRVFVASVFVILLMAGAADAIGVGASDPGLFVITTLAYLLLGVCLLAVAARPGQFGPTLLTVGVLVDVVAIITLMIASGGFRSGLAVLLLFSIAGAAILADRTMTLFHAASASIGLLTSQARALLESDQPSSLLLQPGLLSIGYFVIGVIVNRLAERVISSEREAVRRGHELENQMRLNDVVIQDLPDGVVVLDEAGRIVLANRAACRIVGDERVSERSLGRLAGELGGRIERWRARGAATEGGEIRIGERRVKPRIVSVGEGGGGRLLVILDDVARQEEQGRQLKLVALGRLTASIAHEIRNPLSAVLHAVDLLGEEMSDPGHERLVQIARDNIRRLDRMVSDIMQLGRRDRASRETIALARWLPTFAAEFGHAEHLGAGAVGLQVEDGLPPLHFDPVHLNQILWNLVHNAWRHGSGMPGSVSIRAWHIGPDVFIDVIDDGPGIDPAVQSQVFEPFFTTFSKGTGLGLYIARELAEANGAELSHDGEEAMTTFRIHCPAGGEPA
jgi:two-component system sensor histidine kinase PilS (NtrC family)